jgi:hypothetical protein
MGTDDFVTPGMREQLDSPSFQGLATFGMQPFVADATDLDTIKPDIGVVGAPWDSGTTNRPGARFGPRALRADAYDPGTYHLDLGLKSLTTSLWSISVMRSPATVNGRNRKPVFMSA